MTLTAFLLARIAEDETAASVLAKEYARWERERERNGPDGTQGSILATAIPESPADPARVLAECEAKRRIIEWAEDHMGDNFERQKMLPLLALPYADHPDYREEWKP